MTMILDTKSGEQLLEESLYPKGHPRNPLTDTEVEEKFHRLAGDALPNTVRSELIQRVGRLETLPDVGIILNLTTIGVG